MQKLSQSLFSPPAIGRTAVTVMVLAGLLFVVAGSTASAFSLPGGLLESDVVASPDTVGEGQTTTVTTTLRNEGTNDDVVDVSLILPPELTLAPGSITRGGRQEGNVAVWDNVPVAAGASVELVVEATGNAVSQDRTVVVGAAIASTQWHLYRWTLVTVTSGTPAPTATPGPSPTPRPPSTKPILQGSFKLPAKSVLGPGETVLYTIRLLNSGSATAVADVSDPLPSELKYVPGSVTGGGVYNSATRTLSWDDVSVPAGGQVSLTYRVEQAQAVTQPKPVTNTATITVGSESIQRRAVVVLVPQPSPGDCIPPTVQSVTIDDKDVLTNPSVTLHINANDNVAVKWMAIAEWSLETRPLPRWQALRMTEWLPFQAEYEWTFSGGSGARFIAVWVADAAHNVSRLTPEAMDFASLVLPNQSISQGRLIPYLVHYEAGVNVTASLAPQTGDADLYVWYPGSFGLPDQSSRQDGTAVDEVTFTTPRAGTYLFVVYGATAATYNLSLTPAGGPRALEAALDQPASVGALATGGSPLTESILTQSGLNPLDVATPPQGPFARVFLPLVSR
jgi:uncharacterized repeat protein (TIGR01451 family)